MPLRYFVKLPRIECAESDASAERLIARGYHECGRTYYIRIWQLRDDVRLAQMEREDAGAQLAVLPPRGPVRYSV